MQREEGKGKGVGSGRLQASFCSFFSFPVAARNAVKQANPLTTVSHLPILYVLSYPRGRLFRRRRCKGHNKPAPFSTYCSQLTTTRISIAQCAATNAPTVQYSTRTRPAKEEVDFCDMFLIFILDSTVEYEFCTQYLGTRVRQCARAVLPTSSRLASCIARAHCRALAAQHYCLA